MANWCNNNVVFTGDAASVENVKALLEDIKAKQDRDEKLWLPVFITAERSYMIDINVSDEKVCYRSRWEPNNDALVQVATKYGVDFVNRYDELNRYIFGEAAYKNGVFSDIRLNGNDFNVYHYDTCTEQFIYNNQSFEEEGHVFEKLLEQKKLNFKTTCDITEEDLYQIYGELLEGDLLLKFAEHKNFDKAREVFRTMDEQSIIEIDNFLINTYRYTPEQYETPEKFIAICFLKQLVSDWHVQDKSTDYQADRGI